MNSPSVKVQFVSPLSDVKSRIDQIYSVIEKNSEGRLIKPMILGTSGVRRALFADSVENSDKVRSKLRQHIMRSGNDEIFPLPVTNPGNSNKTTTGRENIPWSVPKGEARLAVAAQEAAKQRIERRRHFHRNCVDVSPVKSFSKPSIQKVEEIVQQHELEEMQDSPPVVRVAYSQKEKVDKEANFFQEKKISERTVERSAPVILSPQRDIKELEKLIMDTHELLEQEGFKDLLDDEKQPLLPEDLVADLEREIEQLTRSIDLRKPRKAIEPQELEKLIQEHQF
jgi:hypothetical protein